MAEVGDKGAASTHAPRDACLAKSGLTTNGKLAQTPAAQSHPNQLQPISVKNEAVKCPECGSLKLYRDGLSYRSDGTVVQRWLCRNCGLRFRPESQKIQRQNLKVQSNKNVTRQVCVVLARGAKNLATAEAKGKPAVETNQEEKGFKGQLLAYSWWMQKQGYALETIRLNNGALRTLAAKGANLFDPESVKEVLAKEQKWGSNRRRNIINAYTLFLKMHGRTWDKPKCQVTRKIPFIPLESEIDELIAGCPTIVATFLQLLKETAMRSGEAKRLKWTDIDFQRRIIILNEPEKGSLPRIFNNLSGKLLGMLNALPRKNQYVFGDCTLNSLKATFGRARRRLAFKLQNPRLLEISFHTLRHWRATMEYHYTKDILHVKEFLGHKEIDNTLIYIQLDKNLFSNLPNDQFIIKAVDSVEEAVKLGEIGFEPFDVVNGVRLYRKRK